MNKYQSSKAKTDSMTKEPITFDKLPQVTILYSATTILSAVFQPIK